MRAEVIRTGLPARYDPATLYHQRSLYRLDGLREQGPMAIGPLDPDPRPLTYHLPPAHLPAIPLQAALAGRRSERSFLAEPLPLEFLGTLLGAAAEASPHPDGYWVRPYPSAGALYPLELHLWAPNVAGLPQGFYRYDSHRHGLWSAFGSPEQFRGALLPPGDPPGVGAPLWLILVANLERIATKYGARAYRFALQETGHLAQNLQLVATALGLHSHLVGAYLDDEVHGALGLDGVTEVALALMPVGLGRRG